MTKCPTTGKFLSKKQVKSMKAIDVAKNQSVLFSLMLVVVAATFIVYGL